MKTSTEKDRDLQEIGRNAYESIADMVAALECDYDRLAELREERADLDTERRTTESDTREGEAAQLAVTEWDAENGEELAGLVEAAGDCTSREDAEQRIQEDPLSLEVRSGWSTLREPLKAEEFNILLCTGGPAVRIMGELDENMEPSRAWLEAQDWFKPWTEWTGGPTGYMATLLTYARCFYFGGE